MRFEQARGWRWHEAISGRRQYQAGGKIEQEAIAGMGKSRNM